MRVLLHTLASGLIAKAQGGSAIGGAAGGLTAGMLSYNDKLSHLLFGKDVSELSADDKMLIANIVTLAGATAGGAVDGSAGVGSGASAGRTEVENNALSVAQNKSRAEEMSQCQGNKACEGTVIEKYRQFSAEQQKSVVECTGAKACVDKANEVSRLQADYASRTSELLEKARTTGGLSPADQNELSVLQVTTVQLEADRNAAIHNALVSGDSPEAKQLAINSLAQAAGTSAAGIVTGVGKGSKLPVSAEKNVVIVDSGKKGAWNKAMNKPEPNTVYKIDGDKTYHTDSLARPTQVEASLSANTKDRNGYQQCKAGRCGNPGDEGGHLIASIFNGPGEKLNLLPMDGNLNKGVWRSLENTWAKALSEGKDVKVNIQPSYTGNSARPDKFYVEYSINGGRMISETFKNAPGGK
ncbi:DNA/RNA non-specific endonuclease [Pantoea agglomerans pv. betae]|nr:DNA/RNA non-specific endonuclease [Pantoea agglomerans]WHU85642.1 DNA/RNA non-specific endonuclease [Pantoea agglomerans pv. betae]